MVLEGLGTHGLPHLTCTHYTARLDGCYLVMVVVVVSICMAGNAFAAVDRSAMVAIIASVKRIVIGH